MEVYRDMVRGEELLPHVLLDVFEQVRTQVFGGQTALETLRREQNQSIVVGSLRDLVFREARCPLRCAKLRCRVVFWRIINDMCFEMRQTITAHGGDRGEGESKAWRTWRCACAASTFTTLSTTRARETRGSGLEGGQDR